MLYLLADAHIQSCSNHIRYSNNLSTEMLNFKLNHYPSQLPPLKLNLYGVRLWDIITGW